MNKGMNVKLMLKNFKHEAKAGSDGEGDPSQDPPFIVQLTNEEGKRNIRCK